MSINQLKLLEMQDIAKSLKIPKYETMRKTELSEKILQTLKSDHKTTENDGSTRLSKNTYTIGEQIGNKGKEAKTYIVKDKFKSIYAMKTFRSTKSSTKIHEEVQLQRRCSERGISPKIIDYDTEKKFIVMEKMDGHLLDSINANGGNISVDIQRQLLHIFKELDSAGVFHGDANLMNYMYRGNKIYIIDFGYSKPITDALIKKLGTSSPNMTLMLLGFVLKLKGRCHPSSYRILQSHISPEKIKEFGL